MKQLIYKKCKTNIGGVKEIYIASYFPYDRDHVTIDEDVFVKSIERDFFREKVSAINFNEDANFDPSGNISYDCTLNFTVWNNQHYKGIVRSFIGKYFNIIVKLNNNTFAYLGFENGVELKQCSFQSGQNKNDMVGYNFSFRGKEPDPFLRFDSMSDVGFKIVDVEFVLSSTDLHPILSGENNLIRII